MVVFGELGMLSWDRRSREGNTGVPRRNSFCTSGVHAHRLKTAAIVVHTSTTETEKCDCSEE